MTGNWALIVLLVNVASTLFLVGLIWFVQVVHYPLFARIGMEEFTRYHAAHTSATTREVALPMLAEAVTSAVLAWSPPTADAAAACWVGLGLVIVIWTSTTMLQVPRHQTLATSFDTGTHRALVRTNWIRNVAWSVRGGLMAIVLSQVLAGSLSR